MKKVYVTFLVIVLALTAIIPASVAIADSGTEVSGKYVVTLTKAACINDYSSCCVMTVCFSYTSNYEGDLVGTAQEDLYCGFNPCSNTISRVGIKTFTGTVLGKKGTFTAYVSHKFLGNGDFQVEQTILSGTDDLVGIQGNLIFTVTETDPGVWEGTYSGNVTFAQ